MKAVLHDNASPFQHPFAGHDIEEAFEAFLKRHELLHLQVAGRQLQTKRRSSG